MMKQTNFNIDSHKAISGKDVGEKKVNPRVEQAMANYEKLKNQLH